MKFDTPTRHGQQGDGRQESEEGLGEATVEDRQRVLLEDHTQASQHTLDEHDRDRDESEPTEPAALPPQRCRQHERQQSDQRTDQPMAVLVEDAADHLRPREEEHVVAECARPVGHREPSARVRDQPAEDDEHARRGEGREPHTVSHYAELGSSHGLTKAGVEAGAKIFGVSTRVLHVDPKEQGAGQR